MALFRLTGFILLVSANVCASDFFLLFANKRFQLKLKVGTPPSLANVGGHRGGIRPPVQNNDYSPRLSRLRDKLYTNFNRG